MACIRRLIAGRLEDQVQLVNELWDRIESQGYELELTEAQKAELSTIGLL